MKRTLLLLCTFLLWITSLSAQTSNSAPYCKPTQTSSGATYYSRIKNVTLGTINNSTNASPSPTGPNYTYYNNITAPTLTAGNTYPLSVSIVKTDVEPNIITVYADLNHNNAFEASEMLYNFDNAAVHTAIGTSISPFTANITIPASATLGNTRFRVVFTDSAGLVFPSFPGPMVAPPCFVTPAGGAWWDFGEVEDYDINITAGTTQPAPSVVTVTATGITTTTATLNGTVNANGANTVDSFQYGLTTSYGTTVVGSPATITGTTLTGIGATVSGLTPNTTYHFRAKGVNSGGTTYGADLVFTTSSVTQPTASLVATSATSITTTTAMLNGTVNANGANTLDSFQYGLTTAYGTTKSGSPGTITSSVVTNVSVPITGLAANTTYHYRLKGVNSGGTSYSNDMVFTTMNNVGVTNVSGNDELLVYPNPSNGSVTIEPGAGKRTIPASAKIYDITGKQIAGSYADNNGAIHFTNLAPQIYLLTISDNKGNSIRQKLVVH